MKLGTYNSSRRTYFILNGAYLVRASLNSLYIPLSVLPLAEISAALDRISAVSLTAKMKYAPQRLINHLRYLYYAVLLSNFIVFSCFLFVTNCYLLVLATRMIVRLLC